MAKKIKQNSKISATNVSPAPVVVFPELSSKTNLECRALLEDQILLVDVRFVIRCHSQYSFIMQDFLTPAECKSFVKFIDDLPLELTPPKKRGEADRFNRKSGLHSRFYQVSIHDIVLRRSLFCDVYGFCSEVADSPCPLLAFVPLPSVHETW